MLGHGKKVVVFQARTHQFFGPSALLLDDHRCIQRSNTAPAVVDHRDVDQVNLHVPMYDNTHFFIKSWHVRNNLNTNFPVVDMPAFNKKLHIVIFFACFGHASC